MSKDFVGCFLRLWNLHLMQTQISFFWLGKRGYVLETVDPDYLALSQHYNEYIQGQKPSRYSGWNLQIDLAQCSSEYLKVSNGSLRTSPCQSDDVSFESVDIVLDYVDKGVAITALADKLGISMDQVMAFGDNLNDLHMTSRGPSCSARKCTSWTKDCWKSSMANKTGSVLRYMEEIVWVRFPWLRYLDGTLLNSEKRSPRNRALLLHRPVLTTGWPLCMDFLWKN